MTTTVPTADHSHSLLAAAARHQAANDAAAQLHDEVLHGLAQFTDSFLEALDTDFLVEADERRLRDLYRNEPAALRVALQRHQRCLLAQRALHSLYAKLRGDIPLSPEERALAEHASDFCDEYARRETDRRAHAAGL
jgi:hypothetical protein